MPAKAPGAVVDFFNEPPGSERRAPFKSEAERFWSDNGSFA
jgi:hypothetical protein